MKTSKFKVKIVCGFRKDQEFTLDANEAHKAYYLFANPEKKMIFSSGLAVKGSDIQRIEPDYHATMDWNPSHILTGEDHNELRLNGVAAKIQHIMAGAKEIARAGKPEDLARPLVDLKEKFPQLEGRGSDFAQKVLEDKKEDEDE
jgi:hypothetical protein